MMCDLCLWVQDLMELYVACVSVDPADRPGFEEVLRRVEGCLSRLCVARHWRGSVP